MSTSTNHTHPLLHLSKCDSPPAPILDGHLWFRTPLDSSSFQPSSYTTPRIMNDMNNFLGSESLPSEDLSCCRHEPLVDVTLSGGAYEASGMSDFHPSVDQATMSFDVSPWDAQPSSNLVPHIRIDTSVDQSYSTSPQSVSGPYSIAEWIDPPPAPNPARLIAATESNYSLSGNYSPTSPRFGYPAHGPFSPISQGSNSSSSEPYLNSSRVSPPTTPLTYGTPSVNGSPGLLSFPPQYCSDRPLYSHREQLQFFREALNLPMSRPVGPFVPQQMYRPHTNSDRRRYVEEVDLDAPIYFWMENPTECGIPLIDALHSRVRRLQTHEDTVFEGRGPSISVRLQWPGYRQWSRQIPTKDFRTPPGPITMAKLAKNVAKCVQRFIDANKNHPLEDDADIRWKVGLRPNEIKLDDLILVSMHHVSMGSWQPQLRLIRPSPP